MASPTKLCPKCGQHGHDARRHNGPKPGRPRSQKEQIASKRLFARNFEKSTGRKSDPVTEADWAELDGVL